MWELESQIEVEKIPSGQNSHSLTPKWTTTTTNSEVPLQVASSLASFMLHCCCVLLVAHLQWFMYVPDWDLGIIFYLNSYGTSAVPVPSWSTGWKLDSSLNATITWLAPELLHHGEFLNVCFHLVLSRLLLKRQWLQGWLWFDSHEVTVSFFTV